jgi:hypothetical protein
MIGLDTSAGWVDQIVNSKENFRRKIYGRGPVAKPRDRWMNAETSDAWKMLGTAPWKSWWQTEMIV